MARRQRLLSVAASANGLAGVYLIAGELKDWRLSNKAREHEQTAASTLRLWIAELEPEILVTENPDTPRHKRGKTLRILRALRQVAEDEPVTALACQRRSKNRPMGGAKPGHSMECGA